jgi:hypothetical protein
VENTTVVAKPLKNNTKKNIKKHDARDAEDAKDARKD